MLRIKIVSSQEKIFLDDNIDSFSPIREISALGGERVSVQLLHIDDGEPPLEKRRPQVDIALSGELAKYATLRDVRCVPVDRPVVTGETDDNYLREDIGLYPDILTPLRYGGKIVPSLKKLRAVWVEIQIPKDYSGECEISFAVNDTENGIQLTDSFTLRVIAAPLPEQRLLFTQWFYPDCLASYYNVEPWCERHWEITENFISCAVKRGRNVMYTPLLTPLLNVSEPFERVPCQLVGITLSDGKYSFDFSRVDRWVNMCDALGVKYFEISHFYTQHDALGTAHVYATVDGEYRKIFGWGDSSEDPRYVTFLRELLTAFIAHARDRGFGERLIFHIADEPNADTIERYTRVKNNIADILRGYVIMDALSDVEFYSSGAVGVPVPTTTSAMDFINAADPWLWVYYACNQLVDCSNAYVAMPSWRTRSIGMQLYKYNAAGFLHWGYNYYNNRKSGDAINPFIDLSGEDWVPAGDTFVVYPDINGTPLESLRIMTLEEALQDIRAMQLCESYYSHSEVVSFMEEALGDEITFNRCAKSADEMLRVRAKINEMIERAIASKI